MGMLSEASYEKTMPKLTLTIDVPEKMLKTVSENSIERVINTTLAILDHAAHEDVHINREDWLESKAMVTLLWLRIQDAIFRHVNKMPAQD